MKKLIIAATTLLISTNALSGPSVDNTYEQLVDKQGNITLPADYQKNWAFLGSFFVENAPAAGMTANSEPSFDLHTVYTQPNAAEYYRQHGKFPDGAVLIKDVNATKKEPLTTGLVRYEDAPKVTFAMVKNTEGRFEENKAWAEGWGWALFTPDSPKSQTTDWQGEGFNNCFACHVPVKDQDWVYTQGYKTVLGQ
ncbi:MAG: cytochrome P460 family protein [Amphritea sp.]|nr:cytochrome P460 family protein [Amphritea sp.]